jgi:hypothetical protein
VAHDENHWSEKAKSLQAQLDTLKGQIDPVIERYTNFKANFGVKEKSDGSISIDFDKFVERLGQGGCAELRKVMDEKFPKLAHPLLSVDAGGAITAVDGRSPADVLAPLVGKTVTILPAENGKPKLRIHRKAAA